jgi:hypothetical protein
VQVTDQTGKPLPGYQFSDCLPLTGDNTAWTPRWRRGNTLAQQAQGSLRVEVELQNARLFALRGDFVPMIGAEAYRLRDDKQVPQLRPGF